MLYQKEIDDNVLIQYIILYTLNKTGRAIQYNELLNLVLDNCNINYYDFQVALDNLVKTEHVRSFLTGAHNQKYEITYKGANAGEFFMSSIPIYIREPIDTSVKALFADERKKNAVRGEISPVRNGEYSADCSLSDDDGTKLMSLSLYAGSREMAEQIAEYFRKNSDSVYEKIIGIFENMSDED